MQWHIGTMGFSYKDWRDVFYPAEVQTSGYLPVYAASFTTVELDTTFHAVPPVDRVQKWANSAPPNFRFCPKTPRQITHDHPIASGVGLMRKFLRSLWPMQKAGKLGPLLIQFPPGFQNSELPNLAAFFEAIKDVSGGIRFAVEFRNPSWETEETFELLVKHNACWVAGDYGSDPSPIQVTADFLYVRFIGVHHQFEKYERERIDMSDRLKWWHEHIVAAAADGVTDSYLMFNNDYAGFAPGNANFFRQLVGLPVTAPPERPRPPQKPLF